MKAHLLNIGDEVLSGAVLNTNASFIAASLNKIGIEVEKVIVTGDDEEQIKKELDAFQKSTAQILLTTGGLGPTHDDLTKETICSFLGLELLPNLEAKSRLESYLGKDYPPCNEKQIYFPKDAILIPNYRGTADGAILNYQDKIYIILVGPPAEMEPMFRDTVLPFLKFEVSEEKLSKEFLLIGAGESTLETRLESFYKLHPKVKIASYPQGGRIKYLLQATKTDEGEFLQTVKEFKELMEPYIVSEDGALIEEVIVHILQQLNFHISFAESCTGGLLASKIISVPGASAVINESLVTYSNEAKIRYLGVDAKTIDKFGVVSEEVVSEMAKGLFQLSKAEVCLAISGIAGPGGGSLEKPVGLVHYAIKINENLYAENKVFKGDRNLIREKTSLWILYRLFKLLKTDKRFAKKA